MRHHKFSFAKVLLLNLALSRDPFAHVTRAMQEFDALGLTGTKEAYDIHVHQTHFPQVEYDSRSVILHFGPDQIDVLRFQLAHQPDRCVPPSGVLDNLERHGSPPATSSKAIDGPSCIVENIELAMTTLARVCPKMLKFRQKEVLYEQPGLADLPKSF